MTHPTVAEVHDPARQELLVSRAIEEANRLSEDAGVLAVWLSGSSARGPVGFASDVDLHVIVERVTRRTPSPWRFLPDRVVLNVHTVLRREVEHGLSVLTQPGPLAEWMYRTSLGDELQGARCLFCRGGFTWIFDGIRDLVASRLLASMPVPLALLHERAAMICATRASHEVVRGLVREAHNNLRSGAQSLLVAALIRCGWTIRGAKKRPEIAAAYSSAAGVARSLALLEEIVGIVAVGERAVRSICEQRLRLRRLVIDELRSFASDPTRGGRSLARVRRELRFQERHNENAIDYYEPLLEAGFLRGPLNHIRALSGFARLPEKRAGYLGRRGPGVITPWLTERGASQELCEAWLAIANLSDSPHQVTEWADVTRRCVELAMAG